MADPIETVRGRKVAIRFEAGKCIHSRHCVLDRPDVFVPNVVGEWIHPDRAAPDEAARRLQEQALLRFEPRGAKFSATGEPPTGESAPLRFRGGPLNVTPLPNGPLKVEGPLELVSGTGHTISRTTEAYLCRCGASGKKPYCDGSHARIGFKSA